MATPRVFVSSTCYDLQVIRENLSEFITGLGYEPTISEQGVIPYNPNKSVVDACIDDVTTHQLFILIIGGEYGSQYKDTDKSITNAEYKAAVEQQIPIFTLVNRDVLQQYHVYRSNIENPKLDREDIKYPGVKDTRVFDFIEEVMSQEINNAIQPFSNYGEIQKYLKIQWAGMMYRFLTSKSEAKRTGDILSALSATTEKIEYYTRQVASLQEDKNTDVGIAINDILYDTASGKAITSRLKEWGFQPTLRFFYENENFDDAVAARLRNYEGEQDRFYIRHEFGRHSFASDVLEVYRHWYDETRGALIRQMKANDVDIQKYLEDGNPR